MSLNEKKKIFCLSNSLENRQIYITDIRLKLLLKMIIDKEDIDVKDCAQQMNWHHKDGYGMVILICYMKCTKRLKLPLKSTRKLILFFYVFLYYSQMLKLNMKKNIASKKKIDFHKNKHLQN